MNLNGFDWSNDYDQFLCYLYTLGDEKYRSFSKKITPNEKEMIGIRIPILKSISKEIYKYTDWKTFLKLGNDDIFEIIMLKGLVIANIKDISEYKSYFNMFIPFIDNWAVCDTFLAASKIINKDLNYFYSKTCDLIKSNKEFKNRVGFVILLDYFVIDEYIDKIFNVVDDFKSDKYYANMALAWLISVCFVKYPEKTKCFLNNCSLDGNVINMIKRKIKDSYRVSKEEKTAL